MKDTQINQLVEEINNAGGEQFWGESNLFERAAQVHDARVVRALVLLHHSLSNKEAISAHVVRNTIKAIDGPEFHYLWSFIDAENDAATIVARMDDFTYLPWAAAFILGEIGGSHVFEATTARLVPPHQARYHLLVRLLSHVLVRYLQIAEPTEPTGTMIDVNTGERKTIPLRDVGGNAYQMHLARQSEADEYFTPISTNAVADAKRQLQAIPDSLFNIQKPQFLHALDCLQTCHE